jgi:L-amino acid N-acyltransferase YncA
MTIRDARRSDVPAMLAIYAPFVEHTAVSFEYDVPTEAEFARRLEEHQAAFPWLVCEENGRVMGYAYAGRAFERAAYGWNAEISCYLAPELRGRGVGRRLYARIEEILTRLGYYKLFAVVTSANAPSVAFHRALGFRDAACFRNVGYKQGGWYDVLWLEKTLCDRPEPQCLPQNYEK